MAERKVAGPDRDYMHRYVPADWGDCEDKYGQSLTTPKPADLRLDLRTNASLPNIGVIPTEIRTSTLPERGFPKTRANGAELILDPEGINGTAIAHFNADSPRPFLSSIKGVKITLDREISIGPVGQKQNRAIFRGNNELVKVMLTQFDLNPNTVATRNLPEVPSVSQNQSIDSTRAA